MSAIIHVVAAVIVNARGEVLISLRHAQAHQGGLWEFPGGKVEPGEAAYAALRRELHEELGIDVEKARPLIRIPHRYPDKSVLLDVWRVTDFSGEPHGREGQPVQWVTPERLPDFDFPAANRPIVTAARLPDRYLITPEPTLEPTLEFGADFLQRLEQAFARGIRLVQLRAKTLDERAYSELARAVCARARAYGAQVLLNAAAPAAIESIAEIGAAGVHLNTQRLMSLSQRPLPPPLWVAASCHTAEELQQAARIGCDFVVLGPVQPTASHPGAVHLDWSGLHALCEIGSVPVYALGGLRDADLDAAWRAGAQGIAAIRGLWPEEG
ncbi:MAG: Nudix family hydrolase [Gammaproteobacteria bacterium]|nr:Nudix family hydrolase [Gammaproteobacteria bacterium]